MMLLERGKLELDFDLNVLITPLAHVYQNEAATSVIHCGVCKARNRILRTHNPIIHLDEEDDDFMDDPLPWNRIHPDERASWM